MADNKLNQEQLYALLQYASRRLNTTPNQLAQALAGGQIGDLAESSVKRMLAIKDFSNLIPGHGGIMDRFDSMTVTAPMIYFLSLLLIL